MDELEKFIKNEIEGINNQGLHNFEGYSPYDMQNILFDTFGEDSPIKLQKLSESDYKKIPLLNLVKSLLQIIEGNGELTLTKKGFLPTKVVGDIYHKRFVKEKYADFRPLKVYKEADLMSVNLTRLIAEFAKLIKKRKNKLSLTKIGKSVIDNNFELLSLIINAFVNKFNWAYYDRYGDNNIGQFGFGFSIILVSKYGAEKRNSSFYSDKYFEAFPNLIDFVVESYFESDIRERQRCYSLRTFERFLYYFGLIEIEEGEHFFSDIRITKTELFDKLIKRKPHTHTFMVFNN